uniref:Uncharacterized protein n=1 Tax=Rhizophora mucronata TaxID=61149 RepID=A0A2P2NY16_RHIMU
MLVDFSECWSFFEQLKMKKHSGATTVLSSSGIPGCRVHIEVKEFVESFFSFTVLRTSK